MNYNEQVARTQGDEGRGSGKEKDERKKKLFQGKRITFNWMEVGKSVDI